MQKYIVLFFSVSLFFVACGNDKVPDGVIAEPRMVNLLMDIHLLDGSLYAVPQQPDSLYKYGDARYKALFKRYRITESVFKKSLKYYSTQPEQIQAIYDTIQKKVQFKIDSLTKASTKKSKKNNVVPQQ